MNSILMNLGIIHENINFLGNSGSAKAIIIIALIWRWTGYNMVFFLAGLQNIEYSVYEAAKIDGANSTITMSHYIYNNSFGQGVANFGYASAMSFFVFILVAVLAAINMKVGDKRD